MLKTFPFSHLPRLPQTIILRNLTISDILKLATCSSKSQQLIKLLRIRIRVLRKYTTAGFKMCWRDSDSSEKQMTFLFYRKIDVELSENLFRPHAILQFHFLEQPVKVYEENQWVFLSGEKKSQVEEVRFQMLKLCLNTFLLQEVEISLENALKLCRSDVWKPTPKLQKVTILRGSSVDLVGFELLVKIAAREICFKNRVLSIHLWKPEMFKDVKCSILTVENSDNPPVEVISKLIQKWMVHECLQNLGMLKICVRNGFLNDFLERVMKDFSNNLLKPPFQVRRVQDGRTATLSITDNDTFMFVVHSKCS